MTASSVVTFLLLLCLFLFFAMTQECCQQTLWYFCRGTHSEGLVHKKRQKSNSDGCVGVQTHIIERNACCFSGIHHGVHTLRVSMIRMQHRAWIFIQCRALGKMYSFSSLCKHSSYFTTYAATFKRGSVYFTFNGKISAEAILPFFASYRKTDCCL